MKKALIVTAALLNIPSTLKRNRCDILYRVVYSVKGRVSTISTYLIITGTFLEVVVFITMCRSTLAPREIFLETNQIYQYSRLHNITIKYI